MKVSINDVELFNMSDIKKQVICNDIPVEVLQDDLERRLSYILSHKYERCMERLRKEWVPKLQEAGVQSIPVNDDEFAALVFGRQEYKDRSSRELAARPEFEQEVIDLKNKIKKQKQDHIAKLQ